MTKVQYEFGAYVRWTINETVRADKMLDIYPMMNACGDWRDL